MARPKTYSENTRVKLCVTGRRKLQPTSDRRAIVKLIVDSGGIMTVKEINDHFGFDIQSKVVALIRAGWLVEITK